MKNIEIGIIGSGNLATHLATGIAAAGFDLGFICSRNPAKGRKIARNSTTKWLKNVPPATRKSALLFVCSSDEAIPALFDKYRNYGYILIHCSGSISLIEGAAYPHGTGVFYPVQSFTSTLPVDWSTIPVCIESGQKKVLALLRKIAVSMTRTVKTINSEERLLIHLAAVFANNFVNAQYTIAETILRDHRLSFDLLRPLIRTTAEKAQLASPSVIQTGPAQREDLLTLKKHLTLLKKEPELQSLYKKLSAYILKRKK